MALPSKAKVEAAKKWPDKVGSIEMYSGDAPHAYESWKGASPLGWVRFALRMLALVVSLIVCVPLYYTWRILRLPNPWPKYFLRAAGFCCGARVTHSGTALRRDVFFISNHLSWLDIPIFGGASGTAFVSKEEIAKWPVIGWLCRLNDTVFVARGNRMAVAEQINQVRDALYETWAVTIFPEGTTSDGTILLPFKSPLIQVLAPAPPGILVQPVYIDYGRDAADIAWLGDEGAPENAWRVLTRRGNFHVTINFLDPFDPDEYGHRKEIAAEARRRIEAAMETGLDRASEVKAAP